MDCRHGLDKDDCLDCRPARARGTQAEESCNETSVRAAAPSEPPASESAVRDALRRLREILD